MIKRAIRQKGHRLLHGGKQRFQGMGSQAELHLEQHFFRRLGRLGHVRRFVSGWIALVLLMLGALIFQISALERHYKAVAFVPGGIYTEGIIGSFTNANPLYTVTPVDTAVSKLLFASLLKYDQTGNLTGDLASKWTVDEAGTEYRVNLKSDITWHDGTALTSDDVAFTFLTAQRAEARSPLYDSWQGIKIETKGPRTVIFTLPTALASFPYSLTTGILPKHLLEQVPPGQLRSIPFDTTSPVGAGPFKWDAIEVSGDTPKTRQELVALRPFDQYHEGAPQLAQFRIRSFLDEQAMVTSFQQGELTAISGLNQIPEGLQTDPGAIRDYSVPLMGQVGVFFKTTDGVLKDPKVRQAMVQAVDQPAIVGGMPYPVASVDSPLMRFHLGYNKELTQLSYNQAAATQLLDQAGWTVGENGMRANKDGVPLSFGLIAQSSGENAYLTAKMQQMWQAVGAKVDVMLQSEEELQRPVVEHSYDALLYGVTVGRDPDVFPYWHSSQASSLAVNRLNLSEYKSNAADKSLEAGRTRSDQALRAVKYKPFLEAWRADAPALMLYQPRYLYITRNTVNGFLPRMLNAPSDRYTNVQSWMIRQELTAD